MDNTIPKYLIIHVKGVPKEEEKDWEKSSLKK